MKIVETRALSLAAALIIGSGLVAVGFGCAPDGPSDEVLQQRIEQALANASDLPKGALEVQVNDGAVTITGSLACEECGGQRTPGGLGTVQQSLGAVVRAVPGVERVEFSLDQEP